MAKKRKPKRGQGLTVVSGDNEDFGIKDKPGTRMGATLHETKDKYIVTKITSIEDNQGNLLPHKKRHIDNGLLYEVKKEVPRFSKRSAVTADIAVVDKSKVSRTNKRLDSSDTKAIYKHVYDNDKHRSLSNKNRDTSKKLTRKKKKVSV